MVSLPDELLRELDELAERRGTTRSGLLREAAGELLQRRSERRAERVAEVLRRSGGHGGNVADLVKAHRPR